MDNLVDRVESKRIDNIIKSLKFCGIVLLVISAIKIFSASSDQMAGKGWWFDTLFFIIAGIISISYCIKLSKETGQFIEWRADTIAYKLRGNKTLLTIEKAKIKNISTGINIIEITDFNGVTAKLDISDFSGFEARTKIKKNFEKLKTYF